MSGPLFTTVKRASIDAGAAMHVVIRSGCLGQSANRIAVVASPLIALVHQS
jgi:hypothetical protein